MEKKINLNSTIRVKLTDQGIEHYVRQYNDIVTFKHHISFKEFSEKNLDNGWWTTQFWSFIDTFGNLGMGASRYYDINIMIDSDDIEDI